MNLGSKMHGRSVKYRDVNGSWQWSHGMVMLYWKSQHSREGAQVYPARFHVAGSLPKPVILGLKNSLKKVMQVWLHKSPRHILLHVRNRINQELERREPRVFEIDDSRIDDSDELKGL